MARPGVVMLSRQRIRNLALTIAGTLLTLVAIAEPVFFLIVAVVVIIAALAVTCSDLLGQRNQAQTDAFQLAEDLDAAYARLAEVLDEHALCPAPIATRLQLVPPQRDGSEYEWPRIARVLQIEGGQ